MLVLAVAGLALARVGDAAASGVVRWCVRLERQYLRRGGHRRRGRTSAVLRAARLVALDGGGGVGVLGHSARRHAEREREKKQTNTDGVGITALVSPMD